MRLVKGCYERPYLQGDVAMPYEGGRVTELVARPLLSLRFPELAGVRQPLAGEWAVRRSTFESLSVPTGYAVDIAALVDTYLAHGLGALAQVDLGRRAHRHQALADLGAMATQVIAATEARWSGEPAADVALLGGRDVPLGERPPVRSLLEVPR